MQDRFEGEEGRVRLIELLKDQRLVGGSEELSIKLVDVGTIQVLPEGEALIKQDSEDNDIYFIIVGSVSIMINGRLIATRSTGTYVGEMAMIDYTAKRSATVLANEKTILLKVSETNFTPLANEYPSMWRAMASGLAGRLRDRGSRISSPNEIPEVFIGCTAEEIEIANTLQSGFSHDKFSPVVWTNKVFGGSKTPIESLMKQLESTDFAILVMGANDNIESRGESLEAPRDNVIFELGLFIGKLGRERVFMVKGRGVNLKIPTDLLGVNIIEYSEHGKNLDAKLGPVCTEIRKIIQEMGPR